MHAVGAASEASAGLGIAVTKRFAPTAVERNRIKRVFRAQTAVQATLGVTVVVRLRKPLGYSAFSPKLAIEAAQLWHTARSQFARVGAVNTTPDRTSLPPP
jgi:ribonuclease P protein component